MLQKLWIVRSGTRENVSLSGAKRGQIYMTYRTAVGRSTTYPRQFRSRNQ